MRQAGALTPAEAWTLSNSSISGLIQNHYERGPPELSPNAGNTFEKYCAQCDRGYPLLIPWDFKLSCHGYHGNLTEAIFWIRAEEWQVGDQLQWRILSGGQGAGINLWSAARRHTCHQTETLHQADNGLNYLTAATLSHRARLSLLYESGNQGPWPDSALC